MEQEAVGRRPDADPEKIESHVSRLPSVLRCEVETEASGELGGLRIVARSEAATGQLPNTISAYLDRVFDVDVPPERIAVEADPGAEAEDIREYFYNGPRKEREREEEKDGSPAPGSDGRESAGPESPETGTGSPEAPIDRPEAGPERPEAGRPAAAETEGAGDGAPSEGRRRAAGGRASPADAEPAPERPSPSSARSAPADASADGRIPDPDRRSRSAEGAPSFELEEYGVVGGRGSGVELRVRIASPSGIHEGTARARDLESLTAPLFVEAALEALERAMDERPWDDPSERILILEAEEVEEVELEAGRFAAVTVRARQRGGTRSATGLQARSGGRSDDALEAALEAVRNLLRGRDNPPPERPERDRAGEDAPSETRPSGAPYDPFGAWS